MGTTLRIVIAVLGAVSATPLLHPMPAASGCVPISPDDWSRWKGNIDFRPAQNLLDAAVSTGWRLQTIDDGVGISLNLDDYQIDVRRMPTVAGRQLTPQQLLETVRVNLPLFLSPDLARFTPIDPSVSERWVTGDPGAQMEFGILVARDLAAPAHVLLAERSHSHWRFVTGHKNSTRHPVSGVREFGFKNKTNGPGALFFTRGADRVSSYSWRRVGAETIFRGGDALWRAFQERVAQFVNIRGGEASVLEPYSRRHCWSDVAKHRSANPPSAPTNPRIIR